ncbi:glycoside hydrolase [Lactobacillus selangorensis]|uniref:Glycoside hydrolase n=2 Tax=Lactobacillus selangorensis TaxID=81857 RepID=A0A0R2FJA1_9LACO|nr:glycoside hydrolase [Lactobacillus selangorensis]KRN32910.1 glycoside hydrolase [Lactobacillus selangorensis]
MAAIIISVSLLLIIGWHFLLKDQFYQPSRTEVSESMNSQTNQGEYVKMPSNYRNMAPKDQQGRVERISYSIPYKGVEYQKQALVYLPAGYSANTTKQYDILYLLHGSTQSVNSFLGDTGTEQKSGFKRLLDHEIAAKKMKPVIVVTPTYYPDRSFVKSDYTQDAPLNLAFAKNELPNDLMPAVEGKYRTYAKNTTRQGLEKSRDHRAFGGFSMGAVTTWYVFENDLDLFKYFMPMSGGSWTVEPMGGGSVPKKTAQKLADAVTKNHFRANDFQIDASVGGADGTQGEIAPQIKQMRQYPQFTAENLSYELDRGGNHDMTSVANQAYNGLQRLFQ